ncbi:hypothetical protein A3C96_02950 [Candidatus Uhrbacteria bacterium RIFCSPHIGHO2_02_FULL_60_10]|uniref:Nitroreductase domain-containing protein n=1 Tax=Candidatus Uhrbacteria bacterium RIFCSPHIGHO2_02_FULL_60_10 TaxID=1802392 RepID=A0A1F7U3W0_9BACT|nr:MAG: hypothetical protein A3C96_02950 [Candidatus Uhrbacteria bacterium RIFCSPHIGHO2_02_FULL_60_10]
MSANNYDAWRLEPKEFDGLPYDGRIHFLVRFAVLAPSSHNSQPWEFVVEPSAIVVRPNLARALPQSDPTGRQLYISIGCAVENICQAADYYGYQPTVTASATGPAWRISLAGTPKPAGARRPDHPALAISHRQANRTKYEARPPEQAFVQDLPQWADAVRVSVVETEPVKSKIATIVSDGLIEAMDSKPFREELSHYVLPNITKRMVGMPMSGFGMPTPPSFLAPFLVRLFNVNRLKRQEDEELLSKHTPAFVVLSTVADDIPAWFAVGRAFQRIALEAVARGMSTAPMASVIEIGDHHRELQTLLGESGRPQMFFRLGYASGPAPLSPRLPAALVLAK